MVSSRGKLPKAEGGSPSGHRRQLFRAFLDPTDPTVRVRVRVYLARRSPPERPADDVLRCASLRNWM